MSVVILHGFTGDGSTMRALADLVDPAALVRDVLSVYTADSFGEATFTLWVLLPLAVFGIKRRLERIRQQQEETNRLLESIDDQLRQVPGPTETPPPQLRVDFD